MGNQGKYLFLDIQVKEMQPRIYALGGNKQGVAIL